MIRGIAWNYGRRGEHGYESENRVAVKGKVKGNEQEYTGLPCPLLTDCCRYYEIILWLFRFAPTLPAKRNDEGKVSGPYRIFKIPIQIKKRSNARFLSTLLRYLSSILTIYFCLRDNLGCPLTYSGTWIWRVHIIPHTTQNEKGKKDRHRPSLSGAGNMVNCAIITLTL